MKISEMNLQEVNERLAEIESTLEQRSEDELTAIQQEVTELQARKAELEAAEQRMAIASQITKGSVSAQVIESRKIDEKQAAVEERAMKFKETGRMSIPTEETRSVLVSSGTIATPTQVSGINDMVGGGNVGALDLITVENCEGMGTHRVAYVSAETAAAPSQTEGSAATQKEPTFAYVDITPSSIGCYAQISKQTKKQSPLQYEAKVTALALKSLKKSAVALIASKLKASTITQTENAEVVTVGSGTSATVKGTITEQTLRKIAFAYGGSDEIDGGAVLFLNKADLVAFGDVRGTNEKKAVYEITPDGQNPNMGTIADGGLVVRYCILSGLTACAGTEQSSSAATPTMFYGNPKNFELDLFSNYEVKVSEDFAFTSLMDTILGDAEVGGDVVVKNGFVAWTIAKSA